MKLDKETGAFMKTIYPGIDWDSPPMLEMIEGRWSEVWQEEHQDLVKDIEKKQLTCKQVFERLLEELVTARVIAETLQGNMIFLERKVV